MLIPAALEDAINEDNAATSKRRSSWKAPTARPPRRPTRSSVSKGVTVMPDILANAGGVTVSYFEWARTSSSSAGKKPKVVEGWKK